MRQLRTQPISLLACWARLGLAALALAGATTAGAQDNFPQRPVTLVVPFPAGGGTDVSARLLANKLSQKWGQGVVVDNRAGAAGIIGADFVSKARPDGYTLLIGNVGTQAINPALYAKLPYDADTAFTPISMVAELPIVLLAPPQGKARNVAELVAQAKAQPDKISYASSGAGNSTHMAGELFQAAAGIKLLHVPYKGGGPGTTDLMAGHVDLQFTSVLESSGYVKSGRLRALAVTSAQRTPALPDVPTLAESGIAQAESSSWIALLGPRGMPPALVAKIAEDVRAVITTTESKEALLGQGATAVGGTAAELRKVIEDDRKRYGAVIERLGLKVAN